MDQQRNRCSRQTIEHFFADQLSDLELGTFQDHLESCAPCREVMEDMAGGESWWQDARGYLSEATPTADFAGKSSPSPDEDGLPPPQAIQGYLGPTDDPRMLGRLGGYEICGIVGCGGMGIVLKGWDAPLNRNVAIKVLAPQLATSVAARQRFAREAKAAAAVIHDNVMAIHSVAEASGLPFFVMPYVRGHSLATRLDKSGAFSVVEVLRVGMQIAAGLAAAHAQGLVHRDIKPANIFMEEGVERVRIVDFGLARAVDDATLTRSGVIAGTPQFMSPEQAAGHAVDHRSDLFSLGSVLYALCTGRPPFRASSTLAVLRRVEENAPRPIRDSNPEIPEGLVAIIAKLQAKVPDDRYQSAAEVADLLERYLAHLQQPTTTPPPDLPSLAKPVRRDAQSSERSVRSARRARLLRAALIGSVALAAAALWAFLGDGEAPAAAEPLRRLRGHTGPVHNLRFTRDGRLVSGSGWPESDRSVRVWDVATGAERKRIPTPGAVHSLALLADERFALAGMHDGAAVLLDLEAGQVVNRLKIHGAAMGWLGISADGKEVYSTSDDGTARRWLLADGKLLQTFHVKSKQARAGALLADGKRLLTGDSAGNLQIWDIATGAEHKHIRMGQTARDALANLGEGPWMIDAIHLTPDGRRALVASIAGVRVHDLETGEEVRHFQEHHEESHDAALSPDGRWLLSAGFDGAIRLWDFESGQLAQILGTHEGFGFTVTISPDGRWAASGGGGVKQGDRFVAGNDHDIRLWDLKALGLAGGAGTTSWLPTLGWVALGLVAMLALAAGILWRRRFVRRKPLSREPAVSAITAKPVALPAMLAFACSACGKKLKATSRLAGKNVKCPKCGQSVLVAADGYDEQLAGAAPSPVARGLRLSTIVIGTTLGLTASASALTFRIMGDDGEAVVTRKPPTPLPDAKLVRRLQGHTGPVQGMRFTPDGKRLISASGWPGKDHSMRIWNLETGQEIKRIPMPGQIGSLDLSPDGKLALAGANGPVLLVDVDAGKVIRTFKGHGGQPVSWLAFARDGQHAFTCSMDGSARRWRLSDAKELRRFRVSGKWARRGAEFPDGRRFLTADDKGVLQVWDVTSGDEVKRIELGNIWISSLLLTSDGKQALVGDWGVNLWDVDTGQKVRHFHAHQGEIPHMQLSPDGQRLLTVSFDGNVKLWNMATGKLLQAIGAHDEFVFSSAVSPDGTLIASGGGGRKGKTKFEPGNDHDIRLWKVAVPPDLAPPPDFDRAKGWLGALGLVGFVITLLFLITCLYMRRAQAAPAA